MVIAGDHCPVVLQQTDDLQEVNLQAFCFYLVTETTAKSTLDMLAHCSLRLDSPVRMSLRAKNISSNALRTTCSFLCEPQMTDWQNDLLYHSAENGQLKISNGQNSHICEDFFYQLLFRPPETKIHVFYQILFLEVIEIQSLRSPFSL